MDLTSAFVLLFVIWSYNNYLHNINFNILVERFFNVKWVPLIDAFMCKLMNMDYEDMDTDLDLEEDFVPPLILKYEDKYLDEIRAIKKDWEFNEEELNNEEQAFKDFKVKLLNTFQTQLDAYETDINDIKKEMNEDEDIVLTEKDYNEEGDLYDNETTLEERNKTRNEHIIELTTLYEELHKEMNDTETLEINAKKLAREFIINQRLNRLKTNFIMEKTPQGNVLMVYDLERETFKYYADSTIPYRYLETVGRKYVKTFNCRPLFVDMEEELKIVEEKWTKEYELKKLKELEEKKRLEELSKNPKNVNINVKKKNVFATFKSYNKNKGVNSMMAVPPKNSIPQSNVSVSKEDEKILLKERANRYTYEGKMANFNFLQKVERKVFNKKLGLSFSDFKNLQKK